jgi:hypothetical protein
MAQHTPGPWKVDGKPGYAGFRVIDANGRSVAAFPSNSRRPDQERAGNAVLIAAAPTMCAQTKAAHVMCCDIWERCPEMRGEIARIMDALQVALTATEEA